MASFKLKLRALPFDTQTITKHLDGDFFNQIEKTEVRNASVDVTLQVTRKSENTFALAISCAGELTLPCDRCLEDMSHTVDADYVMTLRQEGDQLDDTADEVLVIPETWSEFDAATLVRDTVLLTIPLVHTHPDGECDPKMMEHLNRLSTDNGPLDSDITTDGAGDPRWEALRQLKDNTTKNK